MRNDADILQVWWYVTCFRTPFVRRESTPDTIPPTHAARYQANDRVLVCSNAPERIPQLQTKTTFELWGTIPCETLPLAGTPGTETNTLYKCLLQVAVGTKKVRLFLWHINETAAQTLHFSLLAGLNGPIPGGGSVKVKNVIWKQSDPDLNLAEQGICLANAQLYHDLPSTSDLKTLSGSGEHLIQGWAADHGKLCGVVVEFDVESTVATKIRLRTTCGLSAGVLGSFNDPVATPAQERVNWLPPETPPNPVWERSVQHSRGNWPWSDIAFPCGTLDLKPVEGPLTSITVAVEEEDRTRDGSNPPPERLLNAFGKQASDTEGTARGNQGCWGATLSYDYTIKNTGNQPHAARVFLRCRNVGAAYFGSGTIESPSLYPEMEVRPISSATPALRWNRMTENTSGSEVPVILNPGQEATLRVTLVNGGSATLPVNLIVVNALGKAPNEDPK